MLRSIFCEDDDDEINCLDLETVICKVYFPQMGEDGHALAWPTNSCERRQQNKEIRRFHITQNKSFKQFFDLVTSNIAEPSSDITFMVLDADMDWIPVDSEEQWVTLLNNARTMTSSKKPRQLRVKVSGRDGSCVTTKAASGTKKRAAASSKKNTSCCIIPTKTEAYSCVDSSNFLSIKQDFSTLQKQMEAMRLEKQEKKKKKKVNIDKKKRSSKNADIVNQIAYHAEIFNNWSPSKWKRDSSSSSIAVL